MPLELGGGIESFKKASCATTIIALASGVSSPGVPFNSGGRQPATPFLCCLILDRALLLAKKSREHGTTTGGSGYELRRDESTPCEAHLSFAPRAVNPYQP